jgi:tRNA threonylcarbamoyladenosine biosynthesis protein TsaB
MKILAIDLSSNQGSVAVLEDTQLREEVCWKDAPRMGQQIFEVTPRLLQRHGWTLADLEMIAVGRGPGSYTGLRISISYASGLAMPGGTQLYAVKSSEALAAELAESCSERRLVVVGDARRGALWAHEFERGAGNNTVQLLREICIPVSHAAAVLPAGAAIASPDRSRLADAAVVVPAGSRWTSENRYPRAAYVGITAAKRLQAGVASEPLLPIYIHPAVAPATKEGLPPARG